MERLEEVLDVDKLSLEELSQRHAALLRYLLEAGYSHPEGPLFLSPENLQGTVLDIHCGCCDAGERALRAIGARRVDSISVPKPRVFSSEPGLDYVAERESVKLHLVAHLRQIPSASIGFITAFDHWGGLVATRADRQIERILVPGGQRLITIRDRTNIPTQDESLANLSRFVSLPDLGRVWHRMDDKFYPNAAVNIFTKRIDDLTPRSPLVSSRGSGV